MERSVEKATVNANTYDIGGMDVYPSSEDHSVQIASYSTLSKYTDDIGKCPLCLR